MHHPGLKQIFSYYTTTVKLTAEGDVHLSDEALSGLGKTLHFLRSSLFGAIIQIYDRPSARTPPSIHHPIHVTRPPEQAEEEDIELDISMHEEENTAHLIYEDEDPHMPPKPARRKAALPSQPDTAQVVPKHHYQQQEATLTDYVPNLGYFAAGGLSGITSRTATAPLDRLKVYLIAQTGSAAETIQAVKSGAAVQATKHGMSTLWNACKDLWAAGGVRSLFAGMSALEFDSRIAMG